MLRTLDAAQLLAHRRAPVPSALRRRVAEILEAVRLSGDDAVRELTRQLDGVDLPSYRVAQGALDAALRSLAEDLRDAIFLAAKRVQAVSEADCPPALVASPPSQGIQVLLRREPLRRVAVYVPAGRAPLPSSVIMGVMPARVAGVGEIAVLTPPGENGQGDPTTLAACALLGVEEVYLVGGAQAVAAAAFGTQTLPAVDLLVGPGNAWVTEAKRQLQGVIGIDGLNGPSEVVVWAEPPAPAGQLALDLLAQAEHDPESFAILLTTNPALLEEVASEVARVALRRGAAHLLDRPGVGAVIARDARAAGRFIDAFAPEHLELWGSVAQAAEGGSFAGATFVGCPTPLGDYAAGSNHVLPTGGSARFASPLGVETFLRRRSVTRLTGDAGDVARAAARIAAAEGLAMHREALEAFSEVTAPWTSALPSR